MIDIEWVKKKVLSSDYFYSKHGDQERQNDNLGLSEIEEAILHGKIIEQYQDSGRGEACLIAGFSDNGKPVHVVCGMRGESMVVITVYIPTPPKFITPYERS